MCTGRYCVYRCMNDHQLIQPCGCTCTELARLFLQVSITCHVTDSTQVFPCGLWMCMDSGDGRIERELHPLITDDKNGQCSNGKWTVHIWTSDIRGAGTDANVTLKVLGSNHNTTMYITSILISRALSMLYIM